VQFLISGNTLMQLCLEGNTAASAWAEHKPAADLRLSLIGVSMARAWVNALEPARRMTWSRSLEHRINEIMRESMRPLPLDERVMSAWADIRSAKLEQEVTDEHGATVLEDIGQDQRLEIATAIAYGLTLVDPWAAFHDQLRGMGMDRFVESLH
jgi:hypothetical protein